MTQNAEDFNRILNEINAKIDYMASHNDKQAIDMLLDQVRTLEKTFNDSLMNFNFEKQTIFDNIQKEISSIIQKSSILKDLFPQEDNTKFEKVENTINSNLSRVHNDLSDTIKQDFNQIAQGIGALYSRIENLKNSLDDTQGLESLKEDFNILGNRMIEIRNELKQSSGESLAAIIENINKNDNNLNSLRADLDSNIQAVNQKLQMSTDNLTDFKQSIADNLTNYLNSIKQLFASFSEEMHSHQESISSDIFNKKLQELDILSGDINKLSENLNLNEESYKVLLNSKVQELYNYLKTLEDILSSTNISVGNSIAEITEVKSSIAATTAKLDDIYTKLSAQLDSASLKSDDIKNIVSEKFKNLDSSLYSMEDNIVKEFSVSMGHIEQVKDDINDSVSANINEIKAILEYMEANTARESAGISEKLENNDSKITSGLGTIIDKVTDISDKSALYAAEAKELTSKKIEEIQNYLNNLESIISSTSLNLDSSLTEITDIKEYIANTSLKLDDIGSSIVNNLSKGAENIADVKNIFSLRLDSITSKLFTMEDNLTKEIANKISAFEQAKDEAASGVNNNINELKTIIECLRANISQSSSNLADKITNVESIILQKLDDLTAENDKQNTASDEIKSVLENISIELQKTQSQIAGIEIPEQDSGISDEIAEVKYILNDFGNAFAGKFEEISEQQNEHKNNSDEIKSILNNVSYEIQKTQSQIADIKIPQQDNNISNELADVKSAIGELTQTSINFSDKINEFGSTFVEKFDEISDQNENQNTNTEELKLILNNISDEIQKTRVQIESIEIPEPDTNINAELTDMKSALGEMAQTSINFSDKINEFGKTFVEKFDEVTTRQDEQKNNSAEIKTLLDYISDEIEKTQGNISETLMHTAKSREDIFVRIEDVKDHISAIKLAIADLNTETGDKITEKLFAIESKLYDSSENYEQNLTQLQTKLGEYISNVELISEETNSKLAESASEFVDIKSNLNEIQDKLTYLNTDQKSFFEENLTSIVEKIDDVTKDLTAHREEIKLDIKDVVRENIMFVDKGLEYLTMTLDEIKSRQSETGDDVVNTVANSIGDIRQEIELLNTDINEVYQTKTDAIIKEFEPLKSAILDFTSFDFNEIITEIKNQIELSYLNLLQELNKNLIENHDTYINIENTYKDVVSRCASLQECIDDFSKNNLELINSTIAGLDLNVRSNLEKTDAFLSEWKTYASNLDKKLSENCKELEHSLLNVLDELQKTIDEKVKAGSSELKDFLAVMLNNEDLMITIESFNSDIANQIESFKSIIDGKNKTLESSISNIEKNVNEKLSAIQLDLMSKPDEDEQLTKFANLIKAALQDLQSSVNSKLDSLSTNDNTEVTSGLVKLIDSLKELHSKVDILAMTDDSEIREDISEIAEKLNKTSETDNKISEMLEALHSKVDILAMTDDSEIREDISEIAEKLNKTSQTDSKISEMLEALHTKVDVLAVTDDSEIREDISEIAEKLNKTSQTDSKISEMLEALHTKVDVLAMTDDSNLHDEVADVKNLIKEQKKFFDTFDNSKKAQEIDNYLQNLLNEINKIDLEKNTQDIKEAVMSAILSVTDQITFVEETEEIKDFVEEKTNAINQTLIDVKKQLNNIASSNSDMDLYSYTLQDVESDIAKLRLALNEISSSNAADEVGVISSNINRIAKSIEDLRTTLTEEQNDELKGDFGKLNEDILSISARTNKLLLNSDESYRVICDSMEEFNRRTDYLQEQLDSINSKNLENQLVQIDRKVNATMSSSKVLENVMMYLGEWMDGTTDIVNSIYDKTSKTAAFQKALEELKENIPEKQELIDIIENKFEEQQTRIDRLEKKLEKAIIMLEEREAGTIQEKVDNIETQLAKLSSNIEKLTSYVDE